jgi:hypothetical protein
MVSRVDWLMTAHPKTARGFGLPRSRTKRKHGTAKARNVAAIRMKSRPRSPAGTDMPMTTAMYEPT